MTHFIEFFYSEHCLSCPDARDVVRRFAAERPDVGVAELDVGIHLSAARRYGVIATPALVIDGGSVVYGVPRVADLESRAPAP